MVGSKTVLKNIFPTTINQRITTTDLVFTAGFYKTDSDNASRHITIGFSLKPAVIGPTDSENRVFTVGSYHCRFKPRINSDMGSSLPVLAKNRQ
jgi:hypothetical protein